MPTIPVGQLESFDSGSNYNFSDKMMDPMNARSAFDLSFRSLGTTAEDGVLQTIALIETLPGDSFQINFDELLRSLPTVVPLESRKRQYIYGFYGRMGDYWNDWNTFAKKGYTGDLNLKVPVMEHKKNTWRLLSDDNDNVSSEFWSRAENNNNQTWENWEAIVSTSMGENMGLPHNYTKETHTVDGQAVTLFANRSNANKFIKESSLSNVHEITAIPFMMKLRIWRDYFTNKDYWINDRVILPHDDEEFRLNSNGELISAKNNDSRIVFDFYTKGRDIKIVDTSETVDGVTKTFHNYIFAEPYHEFPKDRFTSGKPFLQRGTAPSLNYEIKEDGLPIYYKDGATEYEIKGPGNSASAGIQMTTAGGGNTKMMINGPMTGLSANSILVAKGTGSIQLDIKMADLRKLAIEQTELEKMAKTDGSYAEFGITFFGIVSKNAYDHKPVYIGGTYKEIVYSEVVQTSQSDITPMGSYTGHSSSSHQDYIGNINCDDYGYIMIISCIMPDVIYSEGLADHWDRLYQKDIYLPERSKIGMTTLLNKRLYFDYGDSDEAENYNENLFAYQNYGDCYRYHENEVHGAMAEGFNIQFLSYTQSRILGGQQNWSREFALASKNNVRMDYLAAPELPPFTYDIHFGITAIRKIPYKPIPANLTGL